MGFKRVLKSTNRNEFEWATPRNLFQALDAEFHFTLDPCATPENAVCKKFYTQIDNGLEQNWDGETVFCNPPYGNETKLWVKKGYETKTDTAVVMLLPARTDTGWFHDYVCGKAEVRFLRGRLKYNDGEQNAPFGSMIVIWRKQKWMQ